MDLHSLIQTVLKHKEIGLILLPLMVLRISIQFPNIVWLDSIGLDEDLNNKRYASYVYFIHGYNGNNSEFADMINYLNETGFFEQYSNATAFYFDYFEKYFAKNLTKEEIHNIEGGISTYAEDFFEQLQESHPLPTQIDIVAHSLGGLIAREMLRNHRTNLQRMGITVKKVITFGTPHLGSELATHPTTDLFREVIGRECDVIWRSFTPNSAFLNQLNHDPSNYMSNIEWYFVAGVSLDPLVFLGQKLIFDGVPCDGLVNWVSALAIGLDYKPINRIVLPKDHYQLINDPQHQESYSHIRQWLAFRYRDTELDPDP